MRQLSSPMKESTVRMRTLVVSAMALCSLCVASAGLAARSEPDDAVPKRDHSEPLAVTPAVEDSLRKRLDSALDQLEHQRTILEAQQQTLRTQQATLDELRTARLADEAARTHEAAERRKLDAERPTVMARVGEGLTAKVGELFSLTLRGRIQVQVESLTPTQTAVLAGQPDESELAFQVRRLRLVLTGYALTPKLTYSIQLGLSNRDTESDLRLIPRDAYVSYAPLRELQIRFGQMKVPFGRQRVVSSSSLQLVDRSLVTLELNLDRDVGVYLFSPDVGGKGVFQYWVGIFGGEGRNRLGNTAGGLYFARIQLTPLGLYDDLLEGDHERSSRPRLALSAAVGYNQHTNRQRSTLGSTYTLGDVSYLHASGDLQFKYCGLFVQAEAFYRQADRDVLTDPKRVVKDEYSRSAWGYYVQAGYLFARPIELAARFGELRPLGATDPTLPLQRELGGGLSYYFLRHNLKLQSDYFYLFGNDANAQKHQARLQAQLFF